MIQNGEQYRSALCKVGELTRDIADMDDQVFLFPAEKTELLKLKNLRDSLELEMRAYRQAQQPHGRHRLVVSNCHSRRGFVVA